MSIRLVKTTAIAMIFVLAAGFVPARAQDDAAKSTAPDPQIEEILKKSEKAIYSIYRDVKDMEFDLALPMLESLAPGLKMTILWKKGEAKLETSGDVPEGPLSQLIAQFDAQKTDIARMILQPPDLVKFEECDVTYSKDGSNHKFVAVAPEGKRLNFVKRTLVIGPNYLPVSAESEVDKPNMGRLTETTTFHYDLKEDGRSVLTSVDATNPMGSQKFTMEYARSGERLTLAKVEISSEANPMGPMVMEFRNLKLNQNLADDRFSE